MIRPAFRLLSRPARLTAAFGLALLTGLPALADDAKPAPDASRIVSIGGAVTEIVYALGEEKRLVGRDSTSIYPAAAGSVPDVGYMRQLSAEGVLATNPTAILAVEGSGPPEAVALLEKSGIAFLTVPETFDIEGIAAKVRAVGHFLGVDAKAEPLATRIEADVTAAVEDAAKRPEAERRRVLFILSTQGGRVMASGTGTAADAIITLAGAVNATPDFPGYKPLSDEAIITAKPDVILMMDRGGDHGASNAELLAHPAIKLTPAGDKAAIIRMDGLHLLGFGPRTASAVRDLNAAIYEGQNHVAQ
ncbi:iron complex transport system substrate-binding protein [Rhizobium sp. RU20A]|uniref:heme/hemin ABC transporter substrate-binding protein n=1 Tax=Rhizobium sp. RU20A TaxID=1907412 RepID=UPI000953ECE0|nr:hemin ABC transporter substrate-binding protein [Rhizobium sp. RU20A]SIQ30916.1 iron complex transport system substrate-binding protein [Rhizobium sp. RU20A]